MGVDLVTYRARIGSFISRRNVNCDDEKRKIAIIKERFRLKINLKAVDSCVLECATINASSSFRKCTHGLDHHVNTKLPMGLLSPKSTHCARHSSKAVAVTLLGSYLLIKQLLILSGNVEMNPGPLGQQARLPLSEMIRQVMGKQLDETPTLLNLLSFSERRVNIAELIGANYLRFGLFLLEDSSGAIVTALEIDHHRNPEQINLAILQRWLQGRGVKPVTWSTLVTVLQEIDVMLPPDAQPSAGEPPAPSDVLNTTDHSLLFQRTKGAANRWRHIGRMLGFKTDELDALIREPGRYGDEDYYEGMLRRWLDWAPPNHSPPTLSALVAAMRAVEMERVSNDLKELRGKELFDPKELYANAMKTGRVKRTVIKCLIVGAAGVGKTSIKHLLLKEELPKKRVSTDMLENPARAVSISQAIMNDGDSWHVVRNEKDLMNIIAEIMKAQAKSEATDDVSKKKRLIKTEATHIVRNDKSDRKTPATGVASESWIVNSVEPMHTEEDKDFIGAIMMAEGIWWVSLAVWTKAWVDGSL